jgi:hypothetical protein
MRRFNVIGLALLAIVAIGVFGAISASAHKKKKQVPTTVTIGYNPDTPGPGTPGEEYQNPGNPKNSFFGTVGSTKAKCVKGRTVVVTKVGGPTIGEDKTADNGSWEVAVPNNTSVTGGDQYTATVLKHKIVKRKDNNHKHVIKCLPASETITIPTP